MQTFSEHFAESLDSAVRSLCILAGQAGVPGVGPSPLHPLVAEIAAYHAARVRMSYPVPGPFSRRYDNQIFQAMQSWQD